MARPVKAYAASVGRANQTVLRETWGARVWDSTGNNIVVDTVDRIDGFFTQLVVIHAAPEWLWAARVAESADPNVGISQFMQLVETHAAPEWLWAALVEALVTRDQAAVVSSGRIFSGRPLDERAWIENQMFFALGQGTAEITL